MKKVLILVAAIVLASCKKDEKAIGCETFDLGKAGETYTPLEPGNGDGSGLPGKIYIHNGRVLQDICYLS